MEYRMSDSGTVYRQSPRGNEVLTPHGWTLAVWMLGQGGWAVIEAMSVPVGMDPAWPA